MFEIAGGILLAVFVIFAPFFIVGILSGLLSVLVGTVRAPSKHSVK